MYTILTYSLNALPGEQRINVPYKVSPFRIKYVKLSAGKTICDHRLIVHMMHSCILGLFTFLLNEGNLANENNINLVNLMALAD